MCFSGAELILRRLAEAGARHVFLVPGAHINPLVQALATDRFAAPVFTAHELGAGCRAGREFVLRLAVPAQATC